MNCVSYSTAFPVLFPVQDLYPGIHPQKSSYTFLIIPLLFLKAVPLPVHHKILLKVLMQNVLDHQNHKHFFLFYIKNISLQIAL